MPHVTLNALALTPSGGGVQTYIRELLRSLAHRPGLELSAAVQRSAASSVPRSVRTVVRPDSAGLRRVLAGFRPVGPADVVHALDVDLPAGRTGRKVVTVHDLAVFDVPHTMSTVRARGEQLLVAAAVRRADAVIAVSAFTATRLAERFGVEAIEIPLAVRSDLRDAPTPTVDQIGAVRRRFELPARFVLHVGTVEPRKDLDTLAEACRLAGVPLVLAGGAWTTPPTVGDVRHVGFVGPEQLAALMAATTLVAVSSVYEGFCLPAIEALAVGTPVIGTPVGALPDVLPEDAIVPIGDARSMSRTIAHLIEDDVARDRLAEIGRQRVIHRTWDDVAAETVAVYERVLGTEAAARTSVGRS
ncbi:MAG: glycosyltransferase family 1 protein [Actinomycetota bacterium]